MTRFFGWMVLAICLVPLAVQAREDKKPSDVWAKIVSDLFTTEMNEKALDAQKSSVVKDDTEVRLIVKKIGGEGKFSIKAIKKKYGEPTKVEKYATREDGKVVQYEDLHYPPISFSVKAGDDEPATLAAPKRLWAGKGILENAKVALKK